MYAILTCNGYTVEARAQTIAEAIEICGKREREANDNYARVVQCDGQLVADVGGEWPKYEPSQYERQEASFGEHDY
jgi:hypothetical protein